MSRSMDIFVDTDAPLDEFIRVLESLLGINLEFNQDDYEIWYEFNGPEAALIIGEHDFVTDRDMVFEDYRYHIKVVGINNRDALASLENGITFARHIFDLLKATGEYSIMLTDDIQTKLDEYHTDKLVVKEWRANG